MGNLIGEVRGKATGTRVLPDGKIEASMQQSGKMWGVEETEVVTYWSTPRPDGTIWGEGQGVMMTKDGDVVMWKGYGIGMPTGKGWAANWRGSLFFQTQSQKLAAANKTVGVFEYEIDQDGNSHGKVWEWK